jgi:hypothetical protein
LAVNRKTVWANSPSIQNIFLAHSLWLLYHLYIKILEWITLTWPMRTIRISLFLRLVLEWDTSAHFFNVRLFCLFRLLVVFWRWPVTMAKERTLVIWSPS